MMDDLDHDEPEGKVYGLQEGVVTDNKDPRKLGRVRVRIPGIYEPASGWVFPIGVPGGGGPDRGLWFVPENGSEVAVFFKNGDIDSPRYMPAMWGAPGGTSETPDASEGDPKVRVLAMGAYDLVCDTRPGSKALRLVDKSDGENMIEFDGVTKRLNISSKVQISINSTGLIEIQGLTVLINGTPAGFGQV